VLDEPAGARISTDLRRWAGGSQACSEGA
jgi:hypothetical protein